MRSAAVNTVITQTTRLARLTPGPALLADLSLLADLHNKTQAKRPQHSVFKRTSLFLILRKYRFPGGECPDKTPPSEC